MLTFPTVNNSILNRVVATDSAGHDWYRFVLSFPPHLVREYADRFGLQKTDWVLDPFCGTGTTIVECKKLGIPSIGVEPHPMCHFAGRVKTQWHVDPLGLVQHAERIAQEARRRFHEQGVSDNPLHLLENVDEDSTLQLQSLPHESFKLLLTNSISPRPLHKTLVLLDVINEYRDVRFHDHLLLALAKSLVASTSNLHFGPEVGVGKIKNDAPVIHAWLACVQSMAGDIGALVQIEEVPTVLHQADARSLLHVIDPASISAVITSPPYPNEKDYTRTTRLESVMLGFLRNKHELRDLKQHLLRSNTRNVYKGDDDDQWVASHAQVERIARSIEERRIELGKTSGFERLYHRVTRLYFGGMARHFSELRHVLKPGAQLAYVVGDQASYLRVMIRTGQLLADIASSLGYEVSSIDLFRTRLATATKVQLREEVVVLRWPGRSSRIAEPITGYAGRKDHGETMKTPPNRYSQIIERIFLSNYRRGATEVPFAREEIGRVAKKLSITLPKNLGDIIYSFRYRADLPEKVRDKAPSGKQWVIRPAGRAKYCFALISEKEISPNDLLAETKIPDSTPGLIALYALDDEQALLAKLRYNRLLDIFTGITCYSLQNHLRTSVAHLGQVETDEVYVGVDKRGVHYALPVQAVQTGEIGNGCSGTWFTHCEWVQGGYLI